MVIGTPFMALHLGKNLLTFTNAQIQHCRKLKPHCCFDLTFALCSE